MAETDWSNLMPPPEVLLARRIIEKYSLRPGFNIQKFVKKFVDIQEESIPFSVDALFLGFNTSESKPTILVNSRTYLRRQRFTLAHEIAHYFIPWHAGLIICHIDPKNNLRDYIYKEMESEANRFASELLMPLDWLKKVVRTRKNISDIVQRVHETGASYTSLNIALCGALPPGYLFVEVGRDGEVEYTGRSHGTVASPPYNEKNFEPESYSNISSEHEIIISSFTTIHWFKFRKNLKPRVVSKDPRNSKEIIKDILNDIEPNKVKRQSLLQRINGVVGAANSLQKATTETELLSFLHQRFASNNDLLFLLSKEDFKLFLYKKAQEIIEKNV